VSDDRFYHYTTRDAAFEHILPRRELRFSPYSSMRDPLENKAWGFTGSAWSDPDPDVTNKAYMTFHRRVNEIRASAKLLSLTLASPESAIGNDEEEEEGWSLARMWEQYGETHRGVCLVFKRDVLIKAITASLRAQGLACPYNKPVRYSRAEFSTGRTELDLLELANDYSEAMARRWVEDRNDVLFFRKMPDWRTEREYRFVVTAPGSDFVYASYSDALEAVIVGEKFPRWQVAGAAGVADAARATLEQVFWAQGRPHRSPLRST
jgi:hypothetical protein